MTTDHEAGLASPRGKLLPLLVLGGALVVAAVALVRERSEVGRALSDLEIWAVPVALVAGVVGLLCILRSWHVMVTDAGTVLTGAQARRIYAIGQVGKYLPGSVWSIISQAQLVREYGGSRARMASASLVALLVSVTVALALGGALLPFSGEEAEDRLWYAPVLALALVLLLAPPVMNRLVRLVTRLTRSVDEHAYSSRALLTSAGWAVLANAAFGLHLFALGHGVGFSGFRDYVLAVCAYALAAGLGVLVVIAPAGVGVREAVITAVLAPSMTVGAALAIALLSRVVTTVADFALALTQVRVGPGVRSEAPVFVSRRFPPSVGGMETLAAGVWRALTSVRPDAVLVAHGGSNRALLWWLPRAWLRVAGLAWGGRASFVLVGDAPTYAVLAPLLRLAGVPRATMVLGLDVTFDHWLYRLLVLRPLRKAPLVLAISAATREAAVRAGIPEDRVRVVPLGVEVPPYDEGSRRDAALRARALAGLDPDDLVVLTLGRLVPRKGSRWFAESVLPALPANVHYVVAGDGPEREPIAEAARRASVTDRVHLLGTVSDEDRETLMRGCDLFVQPNVPVPGDMEGFGLVLVEAALRGAPVVAADLEGMKDAVVPGETGLLVASGDVEAWTATLRELLADPVALAERGRRYRLAALDRYDERRMGTAICDLLGLADLADRPS